MPDPGGLSLFRMFEAWDDVPDFYRGVPLTEGMFPPPSSDAAAAEALGRCCRLLPHKIIGSGRFVCLLDKLAEMDGGDEEEQQQQQLDRQDSRHSSASEQQDSRLSPSHAVADAEEWRELCAAYGLDGARFASGQLRALVQRHPRAADRVVVASAGAAALLLGEPCAGGGAAVFERREGAPPWVPLQEGAALLGELAGEEGLAGCPQQATRSPRIARMSAEETVASLRARATTAPPGAPRGGLLLRGELPARGGELSVSVRKDAASRPNAPLWLVAEVAEPGGEAVLLCGAEFAEGVLARLGQE